MIGNRKFIINFITKRVKSKKYTKKTKLQSQIHKGKVNKGKVHKGKVNKN